MIKSECGEILCDFLWSTYEKCKQEGRNVEKLEEVILSIHSGDKSKYHEEHMRFLDEHPDEEIAYLAIKGEYKGEKHKVQ